MLRRAKSPLHLGCGPKQIAGCHFERGAVAICGIDLAWEMTWQICKINPNIDAQADDICGFRKLPMIISAASMINGALILLNQFAPPALNYFLFSLWAFLMRHYRSHFAGLFARRTSKVL